MAITRTTDISRQIVLGNSEVFTKNFDSIPLEYPGFTTEKKATKKVEYYDSMGNLQAASEKPEGTAINYGKIEQAFQTAVEQKTWTNGYSHTNEAIKFDLQGVINSTKAKELARTAREQEEKRAIYWFDNAFATETLADGSYLCAHGKALKNSTATNDTLTTGALSPDTVEVAMQMFSDFKNHAGGPMKSKPTDLLTHYYNQFKVERIFGSELKAEELSNSKNVLPRPTPHYSTYLGSKTAWFLFDREYEHVLMVWFMKTQFGQAEDDIDSPGDMYFHYLAMYQSGALPNIGIVGSVGT